MNQNSKLLPLLLNNISKYFNFHQKDIFSHSKTTNKNVIVQDLEKHFEKSIQSNFYLFTSSTNAFLEETSWLKCQLWNWRSFSCMTEISLELEMDTNTQFNVAAISFAFYCVVSYSITLLLHTAFTYILDFIVSSSQKLWLKKHLSTSKGKVKLSPCSLFCLDSLITEISKLSAKKIYIFKRAMQEVRRQISCGSQIWHCAYSLNDEASQSSTYKLMGSYFWIEKPE